MKLTQLYRTSRTNYVPYFSPGEGRESYIIYNGGGFDRTKDQFKNLVYSHRTGTSFDTKINNTYRSYYCKAPNFRYFGNGKGRETYVLHNGAGLYYDEKPLQSYKLLDFLRNGDFGRTRNRTVNEKLGMSKTEARYNKILRKTEKSLVSRLYDKEKSKFIKPKFVPPIETEQSIKITEDGKYTNNTYKTMENCVTERFPNLATSYKLDKDQDELINTIEDRKNLEPSFKMKIVKRKLNKDILNGFKKTHMRDLTEPDYAKLKSSMKKINLYDIRQKTKKDNYSFVPPYLHLKNLSLGILK